MSAAYPIGHPKTASSLTAKSASTIFLPTDRPPSVQIPSHKIAPQGSSKKKLVNWLSDAKQKFSRQII